MPHAEPAAGQRARWLSANVTEYDAMAVRMKKYLDALDAPLLSISRGVTLELGCGSGRFLAKLAARAEVARVVGLDIAEQMLRAASTTARAVLVRSQAECLPFADASFDSVVCPFFSLRDMERRRVYSEVARVLRASGRFGFTLRNYYVAFADTLCRDYLLRWRWPHSLPTIDGAVGVACDLRGVTREVAALAECGLRVREIKTLAYLPLIRRVLPYFYWSSRWATRWGSDIVIIAERGARALSPR
jgi:SAM-dependent methyltransferase